ncbi:hypothetical protein [Microbacterium sp. SORGH_AS_0888]|uniref:DUF7882 family protein n=1 Tax=Microbacterium sp. SORGH_AS_0888 TaxID=3041791 RepID=UPI00277DD3AE|nr:hypothetical protein [Microbacterium sp. SORGH_AS_0888]MDQ1130414.1 hypothetical protein [Microbacterium sp. SORGH_AS_0888]
MGQLHYGTSESPIEIPDRLLAHVKVVMATKLRRGESFTVSWTSPVGRESIWVHQSIPLRFVFSTPEPETLDPELVSRLAHVASMSGNLPISAADAAIAASSAQPLPRATAA